MFAEFVAHWRTGCERLGRREAGAVAEERGGASDCIYALIGSYWLLCMDQPAPGDDRILDWHGHDLLCDRSVPGLLGHFTLSYADLSRPYLSSVYCFKLEPSSTILSLRTF